MEMLEFEDYCKDFIMDELKSYEGHRTYACDLAYTLCEGIAVDGSATHSRKLATEYIREWWPDAGDYYEYEKQNYGRHLHNPFDSPERFMVCMIIWGCEQLLCQLELINEKWNDEIDIDKELIAYINEELENTSLGEKRW